MRTGGAEPFFQDETPRMSGAFRGQMDPQQVDQMGVTNVHQKMFLAKRIKLSIEPKDCWSFFMTNRIDLFYPLKQKLIRLEGRPPRSASLWAPWSWRWSGSRPGSGGCSLLLPAPSTALHAASVKFAATFLKTLLKTLLETLLKTHLMTFLDSTWY